MLVGFVHDSEGRFDQLAGLDGFASLAACAAAIWIDLESPTPDELNNVATRFALPADAVDDCLHGEQRPRVDLFDDSMFVVLYGAVGMGAEDVFDPRKLAVFVGPGYLLTIHREPLPSVKDARERCARNPTHLIGRGADFVLYSIFDDIVDRYVRLSDSYEERLASLEEASLDAPSDASVLGSLADLRRELLYLRRFTASQRDMLNPFQRGEMTCVSESLVQRFSHVQDHLTQVIEVIDSLRERINGVHEIYHAALATRMNDVIKTLTVFATVLLPMSVIAGIYGMNVPVWPPGNWPLSFPFVLVMMMVVAGTLLVFFRRKHWL